MTIVSDMARRIDPGAWERVDRLLAKAESRDAGDPMAASDYIKEAERESAHSIAQARAEIRAILLDAP